MPVHNAEIAAMFDQAAELLEIKGDNPFRTRAYRRAARVIESLQMSAEGMLRAGKDLSELPGIGDDLAVKIAAIVATGKFDLLESLKRELPGGLSQLTAIPGLGPKRVKMLIDKLGVRSVEDLRRAAKSGRLHSLLGFGPKLEQNILTALAKPVAEKRFKLPVAEAEANSLIKALSVSSGHRNIIVAGSYRRRRSCAKIAEKLRSPKRSLCPHSYPCPISAAISTSTQTGVMARRQFRIWPQPRSTAAMPISRLPITASG